MIGAAVLALAATIVIAAILGIDNMQIAAVVTRGIALAISAFCTIHTIAKQISAWRTFFNDMNNTGWVFGKFLKSKMGFNFNKALAVGLVFTVISVAITWAAFVTQFFVTDMKWGSMGTDSAFAGAIAATIVTVLLFVIFTALGPIGAIVGAIIGLINAIASLICSALPQEKQSSEAGTWLCGGITGLITNLIKGFIYSGTIMVQMNPKGYDRLEFYNLEDDLVDPDAGVIEGNAIRYTISLTNTTELADVPWSPLADRTQFSVYNLKQATFGYKWQTSQTSFHSGLHLGSIQDKWRATSEDRYYITDTQQSDPVTLFAGINHPTQGLYLSEAYAVPEQECWALVGCSIETEKSTSHFQIGEDMKLDVLPSSIGGFRSLTRKGSGWALSWSQGGDPAFPTLYDADGDGLALTDDPDDSNWDQDGDGLSDVYELNAGSRTDLPDTDDDGLTDLQEVRAGSDPMRQDSDGDGLLDCEEVHHQVVQTGDSNAAQGVRRGGRLVRRLDRRARHDRRQTVDHSGDFQPRPGRHRQRWAERSPGKGLRLQPQRLVGRERLDPEVGPERTQWRHLRADGRVRGARPNPLLQRHRQERVGQPAGGGLALDRALFHPGHIEGLAALLQPAAADTGEHGRGIEGVG